MKNTKEQFERDYNQALHLTDELRRILNTILVDIQYDDIPPKVFEELRPLQIKLLRELQETSNLQRTMIDASIELREIKEKKCEI